MISYLFVENSSKKDRFYGNHIFCLSALLIILVRHIWIGGQIWMYFSLNVQILVIFYVSNIYAY